jgi:ribosomal protein S10
MTYVTELSFRSGDRSTLERAVDEVKATVTRKGIECKGPHAAPPETLRVPQYERLDGGDAFEPWEYTVYGRRLVIHGGETVARDVATREYPDSVHVEVDVDYRQPVGGR